MPEQLLPVEVEQRVAERSWLKVSGRPADARLRWTWLTTAQLIEPWTLPES
jgi:hypothetical protein